MFDPLHKWLGIPPDEQPPDDYRLLGIACFESDPEVIDAAADRHLTFLHDLASGEHAEQAEALANRISATRLRLLDPAKRAAYDEELRSKAGDPIDVDSVLDSLSSSESNEKAADSILGLHLPPPLPVPAPPAVPEPPALPKNATSGPPVATASAQPTSKGFPSGPTVHGKPNAAPIVRRKRRSWLWMLGILPGFVLLCVLIYMIATKRLFLDQDKLERLGVPSEQASKFARPPETIEPSAVSPDTSAASSDFNFDKNRPTDDPENASTSSANTSTPQASSNSASQGSLSSKMANGSNQPDDSGSVRSLGFGQRRVAAQLPSPDEIETKRDVVRELYEPQFRDAQTAQERLAIAREMIRVADGTRDDLAGTYALYQVAMQILVRDKDYIAALQVIDKLQEQFTSVDGIALKYEIISKADRSFSRDPNYLQTTLQLANDCLNAGRARLGIPLCQAAKKSPRRPSKETVALIDRLMSELQNVKALKDEYEQQLPILDVSPDDANAQLAVGKYLCLVEGRWSENLSRIANGSDEFYKAAANGESELRQGNINLLELADRWFTVFDQATGDFEKRRLADRIRNYYQSARTGASGIDVLKIDKRMTKLLEFATPGPLASPSAGSNNSPLNVAADKSEFPGPPKLVQSQTHHDGKTKGSFASVRGKVIQVGMGNSPQGTGEAIAGAELEYVSTLGISGMANGAPPTKQRLPSANISFLLDYSTPSGYTKRVRLVLEGDLRSPTSEMPSWGSARQPDSSERLKSANHVQLDLHRWAPDDWDGRVWFSIFMKDAGNGRALNALLRW